MKGALQQKENRNANVSVNETSAKPQEYVAPEVNIFENKDGYLLEAEMPGVNKDGLQLMLENNELTIVGRRNNERLQGEALFCECSKADYRRVFTLDPAIDTAKIAARMDQGILTVTLPKSEKVKPRKIAVD